MTTWTLNNSIAWQRHVMAVSRDPVQIARCKAAIAKLTAQLEGTK